MNKEEMIDFIVDKSKKTKEEAKETLELVVKTSVESGNAHITAHQFCTNNEPDLTNDKLCGCFYCLKIFNPKEIKVWIKDTKGTALCPYCGIDSIIGESSGYPITKEFLEKMKKHWF